MMEEYREAADIIKNSQRILVGIGEDCNAENLKAYRDFAVFIADKDYYVILADENQSLESCFGSERIIRSSKLTNSDDVEFKEYGRWLSGTLNRALAVVELGCGFLSHGTMRWPFEKIVFYNNMAAMIRVHDKFSQASAEIAGKTKRFSETPEKFLTTLLQCCATNGEDGDV